MRTLPIEPTNARAQFAWYLVVGGLAFWVDIGAFVGLRALGLAVLSASTLSFILATLANYFLSYALAFRRGRFGRLDEVKRLFVVSGIGLLFNTLFVWAFIAVARLAPVVAKVLAVPLVLGWNFMGRRLFVFRPELPDATLTVTRSVLARLSGRTHQQPGATRETRLLKVSDVDPREPEPAREQSP